MMFSISKKTTVRLFLILSVVFFISCHPKDDGGGVSPVELIPPLGLAFSTPNGEITVFSLETNEIVDTLYLDGWSAAAAVSQTGDRLFCTNNAAQGIEYYRLPSFVLNGAVQFTGNPRDLYTNASSSIVYVITENGNFWSYNLSSQSFDTLGVGLSPRRMAITPLDYRMAWVVCPSSRSIHTINLQSFQKLDTLVFASTPTDVRFSPDGNTAYIAFKNPGFIKVINTVTHQSIDSLPAGQGPFDLGISTSGRYLVASDSSRGRARVWDLNQHVNWDINVGSSPGRVRFMNHTDRFYILSSGMNHVLNISINDSGPHINDTIQVADKVQEIALWEIN